MGANMNEWTRDYCRIERAIGYVDPVAPEDQRLLYYHRSRALAPGALPASATGLVWSTTIEAGERSWTLNAYPTPGFIAHRRSWQSWTLLAGGLVLTGLGGIYFAGRIRRTARFESLVAERTDALSLEVAKHKRLENALEESQSTLTRQVEQLNRRNREIELLNELGDILQACLSTGEAYPVISLHARRLLPSTSGALYMHDASKGLFGAAAEWGDHPPGSAAFKAEDCWALRRGKAHAVTTTSATPPCHHAPADAELGSLCIPLSGMGGTIGLFHVNRCPEDSHAFALSVAEHVGLALSNLMLRSDLRQMSIHDPLTGLHNRRYMEETLESWSYGARSARISRSASSCSTSTISRRSTTGSGMLWATSCCAPWAPC